MQAITAAASEKEGVPKSGATGSSTAEGAATSTLSPNGPLRVILCSFSSLSAQHWQKFLGERLSLKVGQCFYVKDLGVSFPVYFLALGKVEECYVGQQKT